MENKNIKELSQQAGKLKLKEEFKNHTKSFVEEDSNKKQQEHTDEIVNALIKKAEKKETVIKGFIPEEDHE